jgi:L-histidine N-alpha-methyltransferase
MALDLACRADPVHRLAVRRLDAGRTVASFAEDVRRGLSAPSKFLLPKYLYDELGSRLFAAICALPEYYLARVESEILAARAREILSFFPGSLRVLELGSGDAEKTPLLLAEILERQGDLHYLPIDISASAVETSAERLLLAYPGLRITAFVGDYQSGLRSIFQLQNAGSRDSEQTLALFLGTTLGNLEPPEQKKLLADLRAVLRPGDGLLLGVDLKKPASLLLPAYDDPLGVTAAFNLNLLGRINRELGGAFDLRRFRHRALYDPGPGRIEMRIVSPEAQTVPIRDLGMEVPFASGETIHTESSYRFDREQLTALAGESGFSLRREWSDSGRRFGLYLLEPALTRGKASE